MGTNVPPPPSLQGSLSCCIQLKYQDTFSAVRALHGEFATPLNGASDGGSPGLHVTCTARLFPVPLHGSPKVAFVAGTVHACRPRHSDSTAAVDCAAWHAPAEKPPQSPEGVP